MDINELNALAASIKPIKRRELHCHPSVAEVLKEISTPGPRDPYGGMIGSLTGIDVFEHDDMTYGYWEIRVGDDVESYGALGFNYEFTPSVIPF